jgi:hypothetical protein
MRALLAHGDHSENPILKTRRSCPVVLLSADVRFQMGTVGQGARNGQGGWRSGARGESGGTSP